MESLEAALSIMEGLLGDLRETLSQNTTRKKLVHVAHCRCAYKVRIRLLGSHVVSRQLALEEGKGWLVHLPSLSSASLSRGQASLRCSQSLWPAARQQEEERPVQAASQDSLGSD